MRGSMALPLYTIHMVRKLLILLTLCAGFAFAEDRVFEMRTYICLPGKLETLKTRFRDHTIRIFKNHGMESIGYWVPENGGKDTTLVYIIAHKSRAAADENWKAFRNDPEWKKVSSESEANGKIVEKVISVYMDPADFSQIK
jgi:hypothetical protein